ncbi:zf-HC2 domain-containing protein [Mariniluteicoccus flavus]
MSNDAQHVSVDELADAAEDLLPPERAAAVQNHVGGCSSCAAVAAALVDVCEALADAPVPPMPDTVFTRLQAVVEAESERRASGAADNEDADARALTAKRTSVGSFGQNPAYGGKAVGDHDGEKLSQD